MEKNEEYLKYVNGIVFSILVRILPCKFIKAITYNAIVDTAFTIRQTLAIRDMTNEAIDDTIKEVVTDLIEDYEI